MMKSYNLGATTTSKDGKNATVKTLIGNWYEDGLVIYNHIALHTDIIQERYNRKKDNWRWS
jgi:hypothetical protein